MFGSRYENCQCGERETVEHYILHCDKYEEAREKLIHDMFLLSGQTSPQLFSIVPYLNYRIPTQN